ncbi:MAG TPA: hypothetical protein PKA63_09075 [Oligoflexia bacterium]|nr:hypothetical protein [Oligoflexia bacterium]HMP48804.1 hypothetical protein [Oligoflexia bacterium]
MHRIMLFILLILSACGREEVIHLSSEIEANRVMLGLRSEGIDARKIFNAKEWVIDVPQAMMTTSLRVLEDKRIFHEFPEESQGMEGSELFSSRQDKELRWNKVVARSLSNTLRILPQVLDARVHIYQKSTDVFSFETTPERTASVLIVLRENAILEEEKVKNLVAKGAGLSPEAVSVISVSNFGPIDAGEVVNENSISADISNHNTPDSMKDYRFSVDITTLMLHPAAFGAVGVLIVCVVAFMITSRRKKKRRIVNLLHPDMVNGFMESGGS